MTDVIDAVLIPYARFVERRERRFRIAREFARIDLQATIDGEALPAAAEDDDDDDTMAVQAVSPINSPMQSRREGQTLRSSGVMRSTLYERPATCTLALVRLPDKFIKGDKLQLLQTERWFDNREAAIAALPELLGREDESRC